MAGVPPSGGSPARFSFWGLGGAFMFAVAFRFSGVSVPLWLVPSPCPARCPFVLSLSPARRCLWPSVAAASAAARLALACPSCCASAVGAPRVAVVRCG